MESCRLCFSTQSEQINIFNEFDSLVNIAEIIHEHIGEVSISDALPKTICVDCWNTTETFHKFHRTVKLAQADFLQRLVKCELGAEDNVSDSFNDEFIDVKPPNFVEVVQNENYFDDLNDEVLQDVKNDKLTDSQKSRISASKSGVVIAGTNQKEVRGKNLGDNCLINDAVDDDGLKSGSDDGDQEFSNDSNSGSESCDAADGWNIDSNIANKIIAENFDFSCDVCQIDLKTLERAKIHYKRAHRIDGGYIKCCGFKFQRPDSVKDHIQWHIDPNIFKCKFCDKAPRTRKALSTHLSAHKHLNIFSCDLCGKTYSRKDQIRQHMIAHANTFFCTSCPTRFSSKEKMELHTRLYHHPENERNVEKQRDALKELDVRNLSATKLEEIMSKHFDMNCEVCGDGLKSLQQAQFHYMHEHQIPDGYIKCCGIKFKKTNDIYGHIIRHINPDMLKCIVCGLMKKTVQSLRVHLKQHMPERRSNRYACVECDTVCSRKIYLARHMKRKHGKVAKSTVITKDPSNSDEKQNKANEMESFDMACEVCSVSLASLHHAKMHYMEQHNIPNGYIKCCNMKFTEINQVNDHIKYHANPDIFKCNICGKIFRRRHRLISHLSAHKAIENKRYHCKVCDKAFKNGYCLKVHSKKHENTEKIFPCEFCNRRFTTEKLQKSHEQRIHKTTERTKSEICEFCAKSFGTRKDLLSHIRSFHSDNSLPRERFQCDVCDTWLSNRYTLKYHMEKHTSEPQKCPQCDKISPNPNALACHIREVHTKRIHKCHLCDKSFKAAVALKDHVATHTGEKLYKCLYCPESFIWRPNCYSHQKKAHPDEWSKNQKRKETVVKL